MPAIPEATGPPREDPPHWFQEDSEDDPWSHLQHGPPVTDSMTFPTISTPCFVGITLEPGISLADTAAQHEVMGKSAFRSHEAILWNRFKLKPINARNQVNPVGIGGASKVLTRCAIPAVGIAHVNGLIMHSVLDHDNPPALIPISTLKIMGAIIDPREERCTSLTVVGLLQRSPK